MPPAVSTEPPAADGAWQLLQDLGSVIDGLHTPCVPTCTCHKLPHVLVGCVGHLTNALAEASQGSSKGRELASLIAQLLPKLEASMSGHDYKARNTIVEVYNILVVAPLCAKLSSQDPAVAAAARSEAVAAALAASRTGLPAQLQNSVPTQQAKLIAVMAVGVEPAEAWCQSPAQTADMWKRFAKAADTYGLLKVLHEIQLTCCWVTALARIWPGSILAAPAGVGQAAAETLLLCAKYLDLVSRMHHVNQLLTEHHQQQHPDQQQQQGQQQRQPPDHQQQQQLLPLPAVDITAAVLHTASLLLADLDKHIAKTTSPRVVSRLLECPQILQQTALVVATLFGSQLQLKLLQELQQQDRQPAQHGSSDGSSSSGGSDGRSRSSSSCRAGPSAAAAPAAAERAEGVLLHRVQQFAQPQPPSQLQQPCLPLMPLSWLQPNVSSPVVRSWLQHFEASWGDVLPPHQLLHVAAAIAAAEGASAPRQHPSTSSATQAQQPYKLLSPDSCLESVSTIAASTSSSSSSSIGSPGCFDAEVCISFVKAAGSVLGLDAMNHPGACQRTLLSPGMERAPLLLLASAAAALWLHDYLALPDALGCGFSAGAMVHSSWCEGSEGQPCTRCADLLKPLAWPTVGLQLLLLQQTIGVVAAADYPAWSRDISGGSGGSSSGSGSSGGGGSSGRSAARGADAKPRLPLASCLELYLTVAGNVLQIALERAVHRASPPQLLLQQLQPVSLAIQLVEAAVRCRGQLQQLLPQHSEANSSCSTAAGTGAVGVGLEPVLPAAVGMCNLGLCVVRMATLSALASDVAVEVQQVLQAVMSLCLTALSTAQGQPGMPLLALFTVCGNLQQDILHQHATAAAAAGAAQPLSAAVAAGWFVLGRCLLQVAEQLKLCASQPSSYPLSDWLLTSAQVRDCPSTPLDQEGVRKGLDLFVTSLSLLADAVQGWQQKHLTSQAVLAECNSGALVWLARYQWRLMEAHLVLEEVVQSVTSLSYPEALASLLDPPPPPHQQQQQQQREGRARRALDALQFASDELKCAGKNLCAALPNRYFCNNPGCRNAAGVSAGFGLVRGAACVCGGCVGSQGAAGAAAAPQEAVAARYCSVACQQQHWPEHKQQCPSQRRNARRVNAVSDRQCAIAAAGQAGCSSKGP